MILRFDIRQSTIHFTVPPNPVRPDFFTAARVVSVDFAVIFQGGLLPITAHSAERCRSGRSG